MSVSCDVYHVLEWPGAQWEAFFNHAPIVGAVRNAPQALPFPLRLRPFHPLPRLLRKPDTLRLPLVHPPLRQRGVAIRGSWRGSPSLSLVRSPPPPPAVRWERRGRGEVLASGGMSDSAASSLPGDGVAGSSHSQELLVLAAPSSVASSVSAERGRQLCSHEIGKSTEDHSCSRSSRSSPSRGRDSREESRRARSQSGGGRMTGLVGRAFVSTDRSRSRGRRRSCCDSSRSLSAHVRSRQSQSQSSDSYRSHQVHSRSRSDRSQSRRLRSRSSGCQEAWRDRLRSSDSYRSHQVHSRSRSDRSQSRRLRSRSSGRQEAWRDWSQSHGSCYQSRDRSPLSSDRSRSRERSWRLGRGHWDRAEAVVASRDRGNSGSRIEPAPAVAGNSIPRLTPSLPDLAMLFPIQSGSLAQWDAAVGSLFSAAGVTDARVLPGPAAPVISAAPVACSFACVPAPGVVTPAGAASATGSHGHHELTRESPHSERYRRHSSGRERSRSGGKRGKGWSPFPSRSAHSGCASASFSSASSDAGERASVMSPPPARRPGVGGSCSRSDRLASDRDRSLQPGPSGLGSGSMSATGADRSHSEYGGQASPTSSGAEDDDRSSTFDSVDLIKGDSFRSVLRLIWDFHSLEEPPIVALNCCKPSLALVYGPQ